MSSAAERVRRVPRYMNWSEHRPLFAGMRGAQKGGYELGAFELDRLGNQHGGGLVGTFRNLEQARVAARAMQADHRAFEPSIHLDPEDRFADHTLGDAGDDDAFRIEYWRRREEHYQALEGQPKIANPFSMAWPQSDPAGEFTVSARRMDSKARPRQPVARFRNEADALACYDRILISNAEWEPHVQVAPF